MISLVGNIIGEPSKENWPQLSEFYNAKKITFYKKIPMTYEQMSDKWNFSVGFAKFIRRMLKYQDRCTPHELLEDEYLQDIQPVKL